MRKNLLDFSGPCKSFSGEQESCCSSSFASPSFTSFSSPHLLRHHQQRWKDMHSNESHKLDFLNSERVLLYDSSFTIIWTTRHEYDIDVRGVRGRFLVHQERLHQILFCLSLCFDDNWFFLVCPLFLLSRSCIFFFTCPSFFLSASFNMSYTDLGLDLVLGSTLGFFLSTPPSSSESSSVFV